MTSPWTYEITDWVTGDRIVEHVPIRCDYFTDGLGVGNGTFSGELPYVGIPKSVGELLLPWRRVIWPCYLGQPRGAYVVTTHQPFDNKSTAQGFTAERVDVVLNHREIVDTLVFRQQDILTIARGLIDYALGHDDLVGVDPYWFALIVPLSTRDGVTTDSADVPWLTMDQHLLRDYAPTASLHDRIDDDDGYLAVARKFVGGEVTKLTELEGGFDYRMITYRDSTTGRLHAHLNFGAPDLGQLSSVPMEFPGNILDWTYAMDATDTTNYYRVIGQAPAGQANAAKPLSEAAVDGAALQQGWPLLMGSETNTGNEVVTLNGHATRGLQDHWRENTGLTVTLPQDAIGTYQLGDWPMVRIIHDRFDGGRKIARVRIVNQRYEPSRQGRAGRLKPSVLEV